MGKLRLKIQRVRGFSPHSLSREEFKQKEGICMATILLLGLENDLATQLARVLRHIEHNVETADTIEEAARHRGIDAIFAGGDAPDYRETVRRLIARRPDVPVVLVNRLPENARWLDALELGAADYCGAPFEARQVAWVVDAALRHRDALLVAA
jgi:DNA-binding response OmpR family regulator